MSFYTNKSFTFDSVYVHCGYSVVGPKEENGPLGEWFDKAYSNDMAGEKTFEKAEKRMFIDAFSGLLNKACLYANQVDCVVGGDLVNQIISTAFAMREFPLPFLGLYNACGTFVESLIVGSMLADNYLNNVACLSGSHFSTAERQFRYPLELGVLRSPVTQWTATGAGCTMLCNKLQPNDVPVKITAATIGKVVDYGIMDVNNMGAAMAPAAVDTIQRHLDNRGTSPSDYSLILSGDLGLLGKSITKDLLARRGIDIADNYADCGAALYYPEQKTYMGGSGAACSAVVFNSKILENLKRGKIKRLMLVGTGALMNSMTSFQGESIPCIAHCVEMEGY